MISVARVGWMMLINTSSSSNLSSGPLPAKHPPFHSSSLDSEHDFDPSIGFLVVSYSFLSEINYQHMLKYQHLQVKS